MKLVLKTLTIVIYEMFVFSNDSLHTEGKEEKNNLLKMENLTDNDLIETYVQAKKLCLDPHFIQQLELELQQRSINIDKLK